MIVCARNGELEHDRRAEPYWGHTLAGRSVNDAAQGSLWASGGRRVAYWLPWSGVRPLGPLKPSGGHTMRTEGRVRWGGYLPNRQQWLQRAVGLVCPRRVSPTVITLPTVPAQQLHCVPSLARMVTHPEMFVFVLRQFSSTPELSG